MESVWGNVALVVVGGLMTLLGGLMVQWFASWKEEGAKRRQARRGYRQKVAQPIMEALSRAANRWDAQRYFELTDELDNYRFSQPGSEEERERHQKTVAMLIQDISAADAIPDPKVRDLVKAVLYRSVPTRDDYDPKETEALADAHRALEAWIFEG